MNLSSIITKMRDYYHFSKRRLFIIGGFFSLIFLGTVAFQIFRTSIVIEAPFAETLRIDRPTFPFHNCSITEFGAISDGKTSNTEAFKKAIESCSQAGGGKVIVPAGKWLTGPIHLKSNINLHVEKDATILFSTDLEEYLPVVFSRFEGTEYYNYSPPIYTKDAKNIAITGTGTLDGQGATSWWKIALQPETDIDKLHSMGRDNVPLSERVFGNKSAGLRPSFIQFINSQNILIENIHILNGPMWTIHPIYSDHIIIRGININTSSGPGTDGVVIDSSTHVLIEKSTIRTGDDAIVLKSGRDQEGIRIHRPTENVVIRDCTVVKSHGAIAIGSEMSGDVRNVFVHDITIDRSQFGFRVKANANRGGIVENIWVENLTMRNISIEAIQIITDYGEGGSSQSNTDTPPVFRDIYLKNISATRAPRAISIDGLEGQPIHGISLENIRLETKFGINLKNTNDIRFTNTEVTLRDNYPLFTITDSSDIFIESAPCQENLTTCLILQGEKSENIYIQGDVFENERLQISDEADPDSIVY